MNRKSISSRIKEWFYYSGAETIQCAIAISIGFVVFTSVIVFFACTAKAEMVFEGQKKFDPQSKVYTMVDIVSDGYALNKSIITFAYYDGNGNLSKADTDVMYKPFIKNGVRFNFNYEKRDKIQRVCRTIVISSLVLFAVLFIIGQTALVIHRKRERSRFYF